MSDRDLPRVGSTRVYGEKIEVLYPGEEAAAIESEERDGQIHVTRWIVFPTPGAAGVYRRLRFRARRRLTRHVLVFAAVVVVEGVLIWLAYFGPLAS